MLFRPGDVDDLASKLTSLISNLAAYDPQAIHKYAVDHFSPVVVSNRLDSIYQQLIENRHVFDEATSI
jgi:hypothetical protein